MEQFPAGTATLLLVHVDARDSRNDVGRSVEEHGGALADGQDDRDSLIGAFGQPADAVRAALAVQRNHSYCEGDGPLSARELEVARLLPSGLTNRRIAERLVVSVRTVDAHVEHIRNKLGMRTRAEIATWVTTQALEQKQERRVRCAIHNGEAEMHDGMYTGAALERCARLLDLAHEGQVLISPATVACVESSLPEGATLRDLGPHRLPDLLEPEHVFQLCHPDLEEDFPPLRSVDVRPTNLPTPVASFIGREMELAEVRKLIESRRLVTLTGTAGVGKTSLALRVAAEVMGAFPDGVWLAELAPLPNADLVATEIAAAVRIRKDASAAQPIEELLIDHLRPRQALIVLDNCEHVLTECGRLTDRVLRACPEISIIATSREPLAVTGESVWRVPSLSVPEPGTPPETLLDFDAARLFVDRAQQATTEFSVTTDNASWIAEICARLDGIPLAIELAAARTALFSPRQIAERLEDRFRLLTGGARTADERHQTMRGALDWSYDLLDEAEQLVLQRLSIFAGGCTFEAAEAVCSGGAVAPDHVLELLGALVRKSLVIKEDRGEVARYGLLEMTREYAVEKLAARGESDEVADRHFRYYASFVETNAIHIDPLGPRAPVEDVERIECELDNIRAAFEWAGSSTDALRMACSLSCFWNASKRVYEGRLRFERALQAPDAPVALRAGALTTLGWCAYSTGQIDAAVAALEESLALRRELGPSREFCTFAGLSPLLDTIFALVMVRHVRPDVDQAGRLAHEAMAIATRSGDTLELRLANIISGLVAGLKGDVATIRKAYDEEIELARAAGSRASDISLLALGSLDLALGDLDAAEARLKEGLEIATGPGSPLLWGPNLRRALAAVAQFRGDNRGALAHLEAAIYSEDFGLPHQQVMLIPQLAQVLVEDAGDVAALDRVVERLEEFADTFPYVIRTFGAMRALIEGRFAESDRLAGQAFELAHGRLPEGPFLPLSARRDIQLGTVRAMRGVRDESDAEVIRDRISKRPSSALWRAMLSTYLLEVGDIDAARAELERLVSGSFVVSAWDEDRQAAICMLAGVAARLGDEGRAETLYGFLLPNAGHLVASAGAAACVGAADRYLGMLAATMGRLDEATRHLEAALELETALGARALVALTRVEYARVLDAHGNRPKANKLLEASLATARELGMNKLERDALELVPA